MVELFVDFQKKNKGLFTNSLSSQMYKLKVLYFDVVLVSFLAEQKVLWQSNSSKKVKRGCSKISRELSIYV